MTGTVTPPPPSEATERETPATAPGGGTRVAGVVLLVVGVLWLLARIGVPVAAGWILPVAVVALGVLVLAGVGRGAQGPLVVLGVVLAVIALGASGVTVAADEAVGERAERITVLDGERSEDLGVGSLELDLRGLDADAEGRIEASVGVGEVVIVLPDDLAVDVTASSGIGEVRVLDQQRGGLGTSLEVRDPVDAVPAVEVEASVGIGTVRVER